MAFGHGQQALVEVLAQLLLVGEGGEEASVLTQLLGHVGIVLSVESPQDLLLVQRCLCSEVAFHQLFNVFIIHIVLIQCIFV